MQRYQELDCDSLSDTAQCNKKLSYRRESARQLSTSFSARSTIVHFTSVVQLGYARLRELGSIDLFVVTSLKMNQLSPNFEHKKIGGSKISQFLHNFRQLCNLFANISGLEQDIINRKTALQSTNTPVHVYLT